MYQGKSDDEVRVIYVNAKQSIYIFNTGLNLMGKPLCCKQICSGDITKLYAAFF